MKEPQPKRLLKKTRNMFPLPTKSVCWPSKWPGHQGANFSIGSAALHVGGGAPVQRRRRWSPVRLVTPSLCSMELMWRRTVTGAMASSEAISAVVAPPRRSSTTSDSRMVRGMRSVPTLTKVRRGNPKSVTFYI